MHFAVSFTWCESNFGSWCAGFQKNMSFYLAHLAHAFCWALRAFAVHNQGARGTQLARGLHSLVQGMARAALWRSAPQLAAAHGMFQLFCTLSDRETERNPAIVCSLIFKTPAQASLVCSHPSTRSPLPPPSPPPAQVGWLPVMPGAKHFTNHHLWRACLLPGFLQITCLAHLCI